MLDSILLPLDGTEIVSETLDYLREFGKESPPQLFLLHVEESAGKSFTGKDASAHPLLAAYHDALSAEGWKISAELRSGEPVEEITRYAVQINPSMLVMSTHGRSGLEHIREGSITENVVRQSPCPVLILHSTRADTGDARHERLFRRMLVPLDGSEVSAAIMPCVEQFAKRFNAEVILFHDHPECDAVAEASKRREFLDQHGVELANAGIAVQLDCSTHRRPAQEILQRIDALDIDIVAMVSHGAGGERRALEESVTANVMRHANRPLLVWSSDPQCPRIG
ncbi:MAG: universal stress protein [Gammaproteobacteria bacterium]